MKIYVRLLSITFIILFYFIGTKTVDAKELALDFKSFYYVRTDVNGNKRSWNFPIYKIDEEETYCIQFKVTQGREYEIADWSATTIPESKKEQILLTAYYGYEYPNHQSDGYIAATQAILWELTANEKVDVTFNTKRFGEGEDIDFSKEKTEIEDLVKHHYDKPNLQNRYQVNLNSKLELNDTILNNYDLVSSGNLQVTKNGSNLTIIGNENGINKIRLVRKQVYNHPYYIFKSDGYQDMLMAGNLEPFYIEFEVEVLSGNITINKKDFATKKNITQKGIKFKLKDSKNNDVCVNNCVYETNDKGVLTINNLPYGNYYLYELDSSINGYLWNNEVLQINLNSPNLVTNFYNKTVYGTIKIKKYGEKMFIKDNQVFYEKVLLPKVKYILKAREDIIHNGDLIYLKDTIVKEIETDENGEIYILNLPLGKYYLYEKETMPNYKLDEEIYEINLEYEDQYTEVVSYDRELQNYLFKGDISILKQDKDTKENLSNVKFGLFKDNKLLLECFSDINGKCFFNNLVYDTYQVKELEKVDGYIVNNTIYDINLDNNIKELIVYNQKEHKETITLHQKVESVSIEVPDTNSSIFDFIIFLIISFYVDIYL
ncbi:MAG: SpaA isopeptide-forming pilin-related protein [Bacilli bacterium]